MEEKNIQIAYGHTHRSIPVPQDNLLGVYYPRDVIEEVNEHHILQGAMDNPLGSLPLRELVKPGERIAIITSDISRPCPSERMLPYIIPELEAAGIPDEDVFIVIALGLHRKMTQDEIASAVAPEIAQRFRVMNHDPEDVLHIGVTDAGTPVDLFRPVVEADRRICLGNLEFHYFAGYSGGAKAILPGCASRACVTANHAMMVLPEAAAGRLDGNPVRRDIDQAVAMLGVDFILNVVVDGDHRIVAAVAGDVREAYRKGCEMVADRGFVDIPHRSDIVIAGTGGSPKDINFYQAHKALESARYFVREGGIIILVAECTEGIGNTTFEKWLLRSESPQEVIERIRSEFVLGGHKAAAIAKILQQAHIFLVSEMSDETVLQGWMTPFDDPQK
jgi:nickel-dependent lactate racemase